MRGAGAASSRPARRWLHGRLVFGGVLFTAWVDVVNAAATHRKKWNPARFGPASPTFFGNKSKGTARFAPMTMRRGYELLSTRCTSNKLLGAVVSEGGSRFARARSVLQHAGFKVVHMPAVFAQPRPPCKGYEGLRLAMRNVWELIVATNQSMAVFEDDVAIHEMFTANGEPRDTSRASHAHEKYSLSDQICGFLAMSRERAADVTYLGYLSTSTEVKWGCHALWLTPRAARFLLEHSNRCFTHDGDSQDSTIVAACRKNYLACNYAKPKHQKPQQSHSGGQHPHRFWGYFVQDRQGVESYLHAARKNKAQLDTVQPKRVWSTESLTAVG